MDWLDYWIIYSFLFWLLGWALAYRDNPNLDKDYEKRCNERFK